MLNARLQPEASRPLRLRQLSPITLSHLQRSPQPAEVCRVIAQSWKLDSFP